VEEPLNQHRQNEIRSQGDPDENSKRRPRFGWDFKAVFFSAMLLLGFLSHALNGWGQMYGAACTVLVVPIYGCHEFWNRDQSCIAVLFLAVIQLPVAIAVRPWVERGGSRSMLCFAIADCMFVIAVIFLVSSKSSARGN
jgi:hypothetical protein